MHFYAHSKDGAPPEDWQPLEQHLESVANLAAEQDQRVSNFIGHSKNGEGSGASELLRTHLEAVARRASLFMTVWGHESSGRIAGIFHDIGKYADQMQQRLTNPSGIEGRNHAAAGACWIAYHYQNSLPLALAVLYHHGGLRRFFGSRQRMLKEVLKDFADNPSDYTETDLGVLAERFNAEFPDVSIEAIPKLLTGKMATDMLDVRMMASALDDADFIETEAHFSGSSAESVGKRELTHRTSYL